MSIVNVCLSKKLKHISWLMFRFLKWMQMVMFAMFLFKKNLQLLALNSRFSVHKSISDF